MRGLALPPLGVVLLAIIVGCAGNEGAGAGKRDGCLSSEAPDDPGGCGVGDRAADDGVCPPGEVCSDDTPRGLFFAGLPFTDGSSTIPAATAVGGTQPITLSEQLPDGTSAPFELPFGVDVGLGDVLAYVSQGWAEVTVAGVAPGQAWLRITQPGGSLLYDRYQLAVGELASIAATPTQPERPRPGPRAFLVDAGPIGLALSATDGERLVDAGLTAQLDGAPLSKPAWDEVDLDGLSVGTYDLDVVAGGVSYPVAVRLVDAVDALAVDPPRNCYEPEAPLDTASLVEVCFHALTDDAEVAGLSWAFTASNATLSVPVSLTPGEPGAGVNCAYLVPVAAGPVAVTASAAGLTLETSFEAAAASARVRPPLPPPTRPGAGARAASVRVGVAVDVDVDLD
ncbi:MAG: hypothetical protein R2939_02185 [Kofleriaceae bacterium]